MGCAGKGCQCFEMLVLGFAVLVSAIAAYLPFWYTLSFEMSDDAGKTTYVRTLDLGLLYMYKGDINLIDLVFLGKATNVHIMPPMMRVAQVFYLIGVFSVWICFVASFIFVCKRYKSVTGELVLAGGVTGAAAGLTLGVIFVVLSVFVETDFSWNSLPIPGQYQQQLLSVNPNVSLNWGLYVGAVSAVAGIVACIGSWCQACSLCNHVEEFRYQMLRDTRFDDDNGHSAKPRGMYRGYAPPPPEKAGFEDADLELDL